MKQRGAGYRAHVEEKMEEIAPPPPDPTPRPYPPLPAKKKTIPIGTHKGSAAILRLKPAQICVHKLKLATCLLSAPCLAKAATGQHHLAGLLVTIFVPPCVFLFRPARDFHLALTQHRLLDTSRLVHLLHGECAELSSEMHVCLCFASVCAKPFKVFKPASGPKYHVPQTFQSYEFGPTNPRTVLLTFCCSVSRFFALLRDAPETLAKGAPSRVLSLPRAHEHLLVVSLWLATAGSCW